MSFSKNTGWEGSNKVPQWSQSLSTIQSVCATIVEIYKTMNFEDGKNPAIYSYNKRPKILLSCLIFYLVKN